MNIYIVTYELIASDEPTYHSKVTGILSNIRNCAWAKLSDSSYAIESSEETDSIYIKFKPFLEVNDKFFVFKLQGEYMSQGSQAINDWLFKKLKF